MAKVTSSARSVLKSGSGPTNRASGRQLEKAAKASSISPLVLALKTWISV